MNRSTSILRFGRGVLMASFGLLLSAAIASSVHAGPSTLASIVEPNGIAFRPGNQSGHGILVSSPYNCGAIRGVTSFNSSGVRTGFTKLPNQTNCPAEDYMAVSPAALKGWPSKRVYVIQRANIYEGKRTPLEFSSTPFITLPAACDVPNSHNNLTFDKGGTFNRQMIVSCINYAEGKTRIYSVGPYKNPTAVLYGTIDAIVEGLEVAPKTFGPYGGCVFMTEDSTQGRIFAVCPSGVIHVADWPGAEAIRFVPTRKGKLPCHFKPSGQAFFQTDFDANKVFQWPSADFTGLGGKAVISSELGAGVGILSPNGVVIPFVYSGASGEHHEGSTFIDFSKGCR